ncbi:MAG: hypothetical protein EOP11_01170 [Proteobacteria bacterium]|nr:MAG: hypothetical protein EOP11_01170 [Pseudomonadota bacterium]
MKQNIGIEDEDEIETTSSKGFPGMEKESDTSARTSEEVKKARLANTDSEGGTHGGNSSPEAKKHHDQGGKQGNQGAHPF